MHLTVEEALDLIEKRALPDQVSFWNSHILTCSDCAAQLQTWQALRNLLSRENLEDAPRSVISTANAIFEPRPAGRSIREVIASAIFDSSSQPALAGARGSAGTRQLLFSADEFDIHLRILVRGTQRRITGQLLSREKNRDVKGTQVHLVQQGKCVETTEVDRFGEFEFHEVPEGPLDLEVELTHLRIKGELNPEQ
ncbi:MAG TPA: hypothetical protein VFE29_08070 [Terriglobia bacterium]|nr:hypothetical protein [Terriglobia bacterium]